MRGFDLNIASITCYNTNTKLLHRIILTVLCHKLPVAKAQVKGESMVNQVPFAVAAFLGIRTGKHTSHILTSHRMKPEISDVGCRKAPLWKYLIVSLSNVYASSCQYEAHGWGVLSQGAIQYDT